MMHKIGIITLLAFLIGMINASFPTARERMKMMLTPATGLMTTLHTWLIAPAATIFTTATKMLSTATGAITFAVLAIGAIATLSMWRGDQHYPAGKHGSGDLGDATVIPTTDSDGANADKVRDHPALARTTRHRDELSAAA